MNGLSSAQLTSCIVLLIAVRSNGIYASLFAIYQSIRRNYVPIPINWHESILYGAEHTYAHTGTQWYLENIFLRFIHYNFFFMWEGNFEIYLIPLFFLNENNTFAELIEANLPCVRNALMNKSNF